jgi:hypothetical protein
MGTAPAAHLPVMVDRVLALFAPALDPPGAVLVDATLGRAGHARALLAAHPGLALVGLDTDADAIAASGRLLAPYGDRVTLAHAVYDQIADVLARQGVARVQGVLFDLGVSSPQLDEPGRGFAYSYDAPLDMRMNQSQALTAAEVLNTYPAARLAQVLREYGEERYARRIAEAVVRARSAGPLTSTGQLNEIIRESIPAPARRSGGHPAKRTCWPGRSPRRWTRSPWAAASSSWRTTRWRTGPSSVRWPPARWTPRHPGCRCRCPRQARSSGCSPGGPSGHPARKWQPIREPPRPGSGPPNASRTRRDRPAPGPRAGPSPGRQQPRRPGPGRRRWDRARGGP